MKTDRFAYQTFGRPTISPEFGYSLPGCIAAIAVAALFAGYLYALEVWPVETFLWTGLVLVVSFAIRYPLTTVLLLIIGSSN